MPSSARHRELFLFRRRHYNWEASTGSHREFRGEQEVVALATDRSMQTHHADLGHVSVAGSFLASRDDALSVRQAPQGRPEVLRARNEVAVRVGDEVRDAAIDADDRGGARRRRRRLDLADDRREPLVAALLLLVRRVDPVAETLAHEHETSVAQLRGFLRVLCDEYETAPLEIAAVLDDGREIRI